MKHKDKDKPAVHKENKEVNDKLEELREQMEELQKEKDEMLAKLQRVSADYANFQKRVPKQISDTIAYEKERIIRTLLPTLDNFEHIFQNAEAAENVDAFVKGVRIIYEQIVDILKGHGVEQIKAVGEEFDPSVHEAILQKSEVSRADNVVLEEFQKGYKLNDRVLRPGKVVVNKLPGEEQKQQTAKDVVEETNVSVTKTDGTNPPGRQDGSEIETDEPE